MPIPLRPWALCLAVAYLHRHKTSHNEALPGLRETPAYVCSAVRKSTRWRQRELVLQPGRPACQPADPGRGQRHPDRGTLGRYVQPHLHLPGNDQRCPMCAAPRTPSTRPMWLVGVCSPPRWRGMAPTQVVVQRQPLSDRCRCRHQHRPQLDAAKRGVHRDARARPFHRLNHSNVQAF